MPIHCQPFKITGAVLTLAMFGACGNHGAPPYAPESPRSGSARPASAGAPASMNSRALSGAAVTVATPAPSAGAQAAAPGAAIEAAYVLREKCSDDAKRWYQYFRTNGNANSPPSKAASERGFTSHYNSKTNFCYALTASTRRITPAGSKTARLVEVYQLTDVLENREIALFSQADAHDSGDCRVGSILCKSRAEWDALTSAYMTD